ncbi:MAG: TonB-dependent receptor [Ferruginibacter sp.]
MKSITSRVFYIFLILLILVVSQDSFAQQKEPIKGKLSGKITSAANGEALGGASIHLPDVNISAIAKNDGTFIINNIPSGMHIINISFVGYKNIIDNLVIEGNMVKNYLLVQGIKENTEVVITGSASSSQIKTVSIPVTVIKRDDLLKGASANIIDAISHLPGITQLSTGPAISKPYIRGLGYNRVVTISNGIRQEGQQWGDEHGIEVDDYNVDKIEVLKGPASLMYGSDGLAGVINIISNTPVPQGTIKANINSNYQTNDGLYALNGNVAGNNQGFNWNGYATFKAAHDYKNKYDGYVFNSKFNNIAYGGTIGLNKSWGYSHLTYSNFGQKLGLVEGGRNASGKFVKIAGVNMIGNDSTTLANDKDFRSYDPYISNQQITHQKMVLENRFFMSHNRGHFSFTGGWQLSQRKEFSSISDPSAAGLYFHLQTFTYDLKYFMPSQHKWQSAFGVSGMQQENKNLGIEFLIPEYRFSDIGGFIYTKKSFEKLTLSGGARYDNRNLHSMPLQESGITKFTGFSKIFGNVSGSIGATYDITGTVTAKINVARGFRAPNIAELAANGVHEGTIKYEFGNTSLRSETSLETDGAIELQTQHLSLTATIFYNSIRNYIFSQKLSSIYGGDSIPLVANDQGFSAFKYFQTNADLYGSEVLLDIHPHPLDWLHFQNTISFVRGISGLKSDSTGNLPNIPPCRWLVDLQATIKNAGRSIKDLYFKVGTDYTFKQNKIFSAYQTETKTPGYLLLNAGFGGNILNRKKETMFGVYFAATNIMDVAYQNHLSRLKYAEKNLATGRSGVFNMGRNFSIKINVPLGFTL